MNINSKQMMVESAIFLFKENGYEKVSIKNICDRAGVTRNAFYYHFNTKEDVMVEYFKSTMNSKDSLVAELLPLKNDLMRYLRLIEIHLRMFTNLGVDLTKQFLKIYIECTDTTIGEYYLTGTWCIPLLTGAQENGLIRKDIEPKALNSWLANLAIGILSSWCACNGTFNLTNEVTDAAKSFLKV